MNYFYRCLILMVFGLPVSPVYAIKYVDEARDYIRKGEYRSAIIQLKNHLRKNPDDAKARYLIGMAYLRNGKLLQAQKELRKSSELDPDNVKARLDYGKLLLLLQKYKEVIDLLNKKLKSDDMESQRMVFLGYAYLGINQIVDAKSWFEQAINKQNINANIGLAKIALLQDELEKAKQLIDIVLAKDGEDVDALQVKAIVFNALNQPQLALPIYDKLIEKSPNNQILYLRRAVTSLVLNDLIYY